jgi:peroxiredoxin Q/BCP
VLTASTSGKVSLHAVRSARAVTGAAFTAFKSLIGGRRSDDTVSLAIGDVAPDFELPASDGARYRLSDLTKHSVVVIAWFPKAFTGGCTIECRSLGRSHAALDGFEAAVFAASCDSVETNRAFAASTGMRLPILCDTDQQVARAYGVLGPLGIPRRWTVYVGRDGRILDIDRQVQVGAHGDDIASTLVRLDVPRRP